MCSNNDDKCEAFEFRAEGSDEHVSDVDLWTGDGARAEARGLPPQGGGSNINQGEATRKQLTAKTYRPLTPYQGTRLHLFITQSLAHYHFLPSDIQPPGGSRRDGRRGVW